jgi:hypothetical protein
VVYYFDVLLPILSELQFTKGGPIIIVQVENELGFSSYPYTEYLRGLYDMILPGLLFQTIEFKSDIAENFGKLEEMQPNKPVMAINFYSGWADHWTEQQQEISPTFEIITNRLLHGLGSVNLYMFHGGTNWGFMNGANNGVMTSTLL